MDTSQLRPVIRPFQYVEGDSFLHRLNPLVKLMLIFSVTAVVITLLDPIFSFIVNVTLFLLAYSSKVHKHLIMAYKGAVAIMGIAFGAYYFIANTGYPLLVLGEFRLDGFWWAASGLYRYSNFVGVVALFAATTRIIDLANSLARMGLPDRIASTTSISFGTIPLFSEQLGDIIDAYESRGYKLRKTNLFSRLRSYFALFPPTIFGTVRRTQWMSVALEIKGFGYSGKRTYRVKVRLTTVDYIALFLNIAAIVGSAYVYGRLPLFPISPGIFRSLLNISLPALIAGFFVYISFPLFNIFRKV